MLEVFMKFTLLARDVIRSYVPRRALNSGPPCRNLIQRRVIKLRNLHFWHFVISQVYYSQNVSVTTVGAYAQAISCLSSLRRVDKMLFSQVRHDYHVHSDAQLPFFPTASHGAPAGDLATMST